MTIIELYEFQIGANRSFFTSAAQDILHGGETYLAGPMSRSAIQSTATDFVSTLQIETDRLHPIALSAQSEKTTVNISKLENSTQSALWEGVVVSVSWHDAGATLSCEDNLAPINKLTSSKRYTRNCRHILFSEACGVQISAVSLPVKILESDAYERTARLEIFNGNNTPGYYGGGFLVGPSGEKHQILTTGQGYLDDWTLFVTINLAERISLPLGEGYSITPGCDHTRKQCKNKFNNIENFGGFSYIEFDIKSE